MKEKNKRQRKGLTLVELLVASTIVAITISGIYSSFSMGIRVFRQAEEGLDRTQELRVFLVFLRKELRNMVAYEQHPFEGKANEIQFPTLTKRYTSRGYETELFLVRYRVESNRIVREEERIREKAGGGQEKRKWVVLDRIKGGEFSFPFKDTETEGVIWRDIWNPEEKLGLPAGVRLRMQLVGSEAKGSIHVGAPQKKAPPVFFDQIFSLPQGNWGEL